MWIFTSWGDAAVVLQTALRVLHMLCRLTSGLRVFAALVGPDGALYPTYAGSEQEVGTG
jgi:hypothetical protein